MVVASRVVAAFSTAEGTVIWLPAMGATLSSGAPLVRVDEMPVIVVSGDVPVYRDLVEPSMGNQLSGADVRQLEEFLAATGFFAGTVDDQSTELSWSAAADWRADNGLTPRRGFTAAELSFLPGPGPWQVTDTSLTTGGVFAGGPVLTVSTGASLVTVTLASGPEVDRPVPAGAGPARSHFGAAL